MIKGIGELRQADESLTHQIVDTFATVQQSDFSWTEKVWSSIAKVDGTVQISFGLGKYQNRGVMDGFGGISRGREQWTVRASREMHGSAEDATVGPVLYEVIEPLVRTRFCLRPNEVLPVSFDVEISAVMPPFFEERNLARNKTSGRVEVDVVRYHQAGWASGSLTINGELIEVRPDEWFGFRDHSWGVRQAVGLAPSDIIPPSTNRDRSRPGGFKWSPMFLRRPDGTFDGLAIHVNQSRKWGSTSAYANHADGSQDLIRSVVPQITYDPKTRFIRDGCLEITMASGEERIIEVEALGESGFFLKPAGYGEWADHKHGVWKGPRHVDGEYIANCWDDEHLPLLGQLRDTPIRVREGAAEGFGIMESLMQGDWPELGLQADSDHAVDYS